MITVRPAVPTESLAVPQIAVVHPVAVLARRSRPPPAQQAEGGDDRIERIRVLGVVRHAAILHAT